MISAIFWISVVLILYPYVVYPVILAALSRLSPKNVVRGEYKPRVSILIPAYNEASCIAATIINKLEQNYPRDKLEIIVISDESTDGTDEIVTKLMLNDTRLRLLRQAPRRGKASGLNMAVKEASGDIIIFNDANSMYRHDDEAISKLVENFYDQSIGYVTGNLNYMVQGNSASEHGSDAYMKFENMLRKIESKFDSIIGSNGGVDAIRKSLYKDIPQDQITDFVLPLHVIEQGKRVIYDERVQNYEAPNSEMSAEFRMRVRVALRAMRGLIYMRKILNPFQFGRASFCLLSHKVIRYLAPVFMITAMTTNIILAYYANMYAIILVFQMLIYAAALAGLSAGMPGFIRKITKVPTYFLLTNSAFFIAIIKMLKGEKMATWKPRTG